MKKIFFVAGLFVMVFISSSNYSEAAGTTTATSSVETVASTSPAETIDTSHNREKIKSSVQDYFSDVPTMIEVARCESNFRQFTDSGNVLRGGAGNQMIGVFQFYGKIHAKGALALGFDINTVEGNLNYARHVYEQQGTTPWNSSKSCWERKTIKKAKKLVVADSTISNEELETKIKLLIQLLELLKQLKALQGR